MSPSRYCDVHACAFRTCPNPRPFDSLQYCALHKCHSTTGCQELVRTITDPGATTGTAAAATAATLLNHLAAALGTGGIASAGLDLDGVLGMGGGWCGGGTQGRYCARHTCQGDGGRCGEEIVPLVHGTTTYHGQDERGRRGRRRRRREDTGPSRQSPDANSLNELSRFCRQHKCLLRGCAAEATRQINNGEAGGTCDRHYPPEDNGSNSQGSGSHHRRRHQHHEKNRSNGPAPPFGGFPPPFGMMPPPGPMPMMMPTPAMGYPPFFPPGFCPPMYDGESDSGFSDEFDNEGSERRAPNSPPYRGVFF